MTDIQIEFKVFDTDAMDFVDDERLMYFTLSDMRYDDPYIFMQRTALHSINYEPIYNHMIVRSKFTGLYRVVDMFDYRLMSVLSHNHLEIVGNRFQHPELLEMCK